MEKSFEICKEMIQQRDYVIIDEDDERILATKPNDEQMCVFLLNTPKFNVESIQEYIVMMKKMDVNHCIIIYRDNVTPVAKKIVEDSCELTIELFHEQELKCNITKHYLVPKHELLYKKGTDENTSFKAKYSDKFPILLKTDPIARFYGFDKGDIIKITRKNGFITYRIVK